MPSNLFITTDKVTFSGLNMICNRMNCKKYPILCNCSQASNWLEGSRTTPELPPPSLSFDYSSNFRFFFNFKFWNYIGRLLNYHLSLYPWTILQIFFFILISTSNFGISNRFWSTIHLSFIGLFFNFSFLDSQIFEFANFLVTPELPPPSLFLDPYSIFQY